LVTNDDLYGIAERRGHVVVCESLTETPSFSLQTNKRCYIAIDQRLNVQQEREALAHELGHCEYGGFYNRYSRYDIRAKAERRADKWAFARLVPYGRLMQAVRHGVTEVWDLAELFDVSCEFMQRAIAYYKTAIL
jgi:Zn-dependent peptidase ImmA (M78 family)